MISKYPFSLPYNVIEELYVRKYAGAPKIQKNCVKVDSFEINRFDMENGSTTEVITIYVSDTNDHKPDVLIVVQEKKKENTGTCLFWTMAYDSENNFECLISNLLERVERIDSVPDVLKENIIRGFLERKDKIKEIYLGVITFNDSKAKWNSQKKSEEQKEGFFRRLIPKIVTLLMIFVVGVIFSTMIEFVFYVTRDDYLFGSQFLIVTLVEFLTSKF